MVDMLHEECMPSGRNNNPKKKKKFCFKNYFQQTPWEPYIILQLVLCMITHMNSFLGSFRMQMYSESEVCY